VEGAWNRRKSPPDFVESFLRRQSPMPLDILIGRCLAYLRHPCAAWRRLPVAGRALLVGAYVAASYAIVLTLLSL
jgi:hypothetical protein